MEDEQKLILNEYRRNPNQKINKVAKNLNIPLGNAIIGFNNLKLNYIDKFICLVNFDKIGFPIHVHLKFKANNVYKIKDIIRLNDFINSAYELENNNFYIECFFKNMNDYSDFCEYLIECDCSNIREHHIVEDISREQFVF